MSDNQDRDLQKITDSLKIQGALRNHLIGKNLYIKGVSPSPDVKLVGFSNFARNEIMIDSGTFTLDGQQFPLITLFRILGRYVEITCHFVRVDPSSRYPVYLVESMAIASKQRAHIRIPVFSDEVYITNFRTSKHSIEATMYNIPTSVKVNFSIFEQELKNRADFVKVDVFGKRDPRFDEVKKQKKPLLLKDTHAPSSYQASSTEFINYAKVLGIEMSEKIEEYRKNKVVSELVYPIIYKTLDDDDVPLGYVQLQSRTRYFDDLTMQDIANKVSELVQKIQESNIVLIKEKQRVINLSHGGFKVQINHGELKDYLMKQRGFTSDIVFRMQAPVTLYTAIRSAAKTYNGDLLLGLQIIGNSSRENEMKRYTDNINHMEAQIKKRGRL